MEITTYILILVCISGFILGVIEKKLSNKKLIHCPICNIKLEDYRKTGGGWCEECTIWYRDDKK